MKYIFNGEISYDDGTFVLKKIGDTDKISLNPGAGRALSFLAEQQGRECRKCELVEEIWGKHGFVVGSNSLNQIIVQLRKAFQTIDPGREYIVTIPRVGYKFVAELEEEEAAPISVADPTAPPAEEAPRQRGHGLRVIVFRLVELMRISCQSMARLF